jgi:pSer/pThr/pTyr-binding forkhead associated (FHA) protein
MGPVNVELALDSGVRRGRVQITPSYKEADGPTGVDLLLSDGRTLHMNGERAVLGRLPECDIALNDANASRMHSEIRWNGRGYDVRDLGSMNGTYLNDERLVEPTLLRTGDVITIGRTRIEVRLS